MPTLSLWQYSRAIQPFDWGTCFFGWGEEFFNGIGKISARGMQIFAWGKHFSTRGKKKSARGMPLSSWDVFFFNWGEHLFTWGEQRASIYALPADFCLLQVKGKYPLSELAPTHHQKDEI